MSSHGATVQMETVEYSDPRRLPGAPLVSVLMLVYNHRAHLAQAIESVMAQETDFSFELLIGEDRSTDGSLDIAMEYQRKFPQAIRVLTAERNVGAYRNYMRLLDASRGEFIAYIDGDDYWLPGKLERQVALLLDRPKAVAVYANAIVSDNSGDRIGCFNDVGDERFDLTAMVRRGNFLCTSTMLFRASQANTLRAIGHEFIDYQMHLAHAQSGALLHVGEPLAVYRSQSAGSMVANDNARVRELYWQAIQSVPRCLVADSDYAKGLADFMRRVAFRAFRIRRWELVAEWSGRVLAASPYGALRTWMLVVASIARIACKEAAGRMGLATGGRRARVLYRR